MGYLFCPFWVAHFILQSIIKSSLDNVAALRFSEFHIDFIHRNDVILEFLFILYMPLQKQFNFSKLKR